MQPPTTQPPADKRPYTSDIDVAYAAWKSTPGPDTMASVVRALEPTIASEVYNYPGSKPLLRMRAKPLVIQAIKSYDPSRGAALRSWATTNLRPLSRASNQLRLVHASEDNIRLADEANTLRGAMSDELGRDPTDNELADRAGVSVTRLRKAREAVPAVTSEGVYVSEAGVSQLPAIETQERSETAVEGIYQSLDTDGKQLLDWALGRNGQPRLPSNEIARRLNISPAAVSQRLKALSARIQYVVGHAV